jgi:hypothetical protein
VRGIRARFLIISEPTCKLTLLIKRIKLIAFNLILHTGFVFRSFDLDSLSIDYHSLNENEYLGLAEEMVRSKIPLSCIQDNDHIK